MVHFICYMLRRLFCYACLVSSSGNWEVQCGQRVALMSISLMQKGHFLVVGAAGSSFLAPKDVTLFTAFSRQNRMNAIIMKLTTEEMKEDANPDTSWSEYVAPPVSTLRTGLMKLSVKEVTIPEKAPPIITPIAMSMTLPRRANVLNSSMNFFIGISP